MADIKDIDAYFATVVRNFDKKDFKSNDEFFEMFSSVGDEVDLQRIDPRDNHEPHYAETELCERSPKNWLLFMENEKLHTALSRLTRNQLEFVFELAMLDFDQAEYALRKGITKQAVSDYFRRIKKKIKKYF